MYLGFTAILSAQISQPFAPLQLQGEARATQIPPFSNATTPQCDGSGEVYLQISTPTANNSFSLASVDSDGSTQIIQPTTTAQQQDNHVFLFSAAGDGSLHEIMRVPEPSDQDQPSTEVQYTTFDTDGTLRSQSSFAQDFIPSLLIPFPDGNFFASGVTLKDAGDGVSETASVGIFNSDAKLVDHVRKDPRKRKAGASDADDAEEGSVFDSGVARLGSDGNVYVLLPGDHIEVAVVAESGRILRDMHLQEPYQNDVAHDMWVSGNRILVVYEHESDDPRDAYVYVLYDAQSGNVVRVYQPKFSGTIACFQDGQTLSVLLQEPASGRISLGTADLR